jgi:hypothetical protein
MRLEHSKSQLSQYLGVTQALPQDVVPAIKMPFLLTKIAVNGGSLQLTCCMLYGPSCRLRNVGLALPRAKREVDLRKCLPICRNGA